MRSFAVAPAVAAILAVGTGAHASQPTQMVPVVTLPRASDADLIRGPWKSDAAPGVHLMIVVWASGMTSIDAPGRFSAAGFFDGSEIVALTVESDRVGTPASIARPGFLKARVSQGKRIEAEFFQELDGVLLRKEIWTPADPRLFGFVEELPEAIEKVPPEYPDRIRRKGISGTVLVKALIGADGLVKETRLDRSIPDLDAYAVAAVKRWRFRPAQTKGGPVAVWVAVPVRFEPGPAVVKPPRPSGD